MAFVFFLTLVLPHDPDVHDLPVSVLGAVLLVLGAFVLRFGDDLDDNSLSAVVVLTTVVVALGNFAAGTTAGYAFLFTWTALYAFYFLSLRFALAHLGLVGVAYLIQLFVNPGPSGPVRWVLVVGTPALTGLLISRLLSVVREEAGRNRRVLETTHAAYAAIDPDGCVTGWNAAAEGMFGIAASEAVGRKFAELVYPPDRRDAHDERRHRFLAQDEVRGERFTTEYTRKDGTTFPAEATVSRVESEGRTVFATFIRDLTEERERERERAELVREQAARREAEQIAEMVSGMQLLVDAALAHSTTDGMLSELIPRVRAVLGADAASVMLREEGADALLVRASTGGDPEQRARIPFGAYFTGIVAAERRPMLEQDPPLAEVADPAMREAEITSLMGVPLMAEGEVAGVLSVGAREPRRFSSEDLGMLRLAADRVALALEHARVYEREHRIAETLQRSLLPDRLPKLPGLDVSARYVPAASEAEVGGDWFDVIPMPAGKVGLVMGDVAGKGLSAASMVGSLRSALRAYALEGHEPATVLEQLNRLLWSELEDSQMATLIYVVFDPLEGDLRWVNAGHLPPLRIEAEAPAAFLDGARSVPLGVMPFPTFEEGSAQLCQGSTVLLYTDGLVERPGSVIDRGLDALADAVDGSPRGTEELCDHLLAELAPAGGAGDDVALLALCNQPVGDRFEVSLPARPESLASARAVVRRWLRHAGSSEQEIAEVTTACGEACTNAIEHAGAGGSSSFELEGEREGAAIRVVVRDFGAWRPGREDDQGRGLSLIHALMDEVEVTPSPEGTTVRMERRLNGTEA
jgi:PAS domain S-box-containing protein